MQGKRTDCGSRNDCRRPADAADAVVSAPSSVSGVSEVSSAAVSHAGASGSEFVNAAKAEANAKTNDASFRDIYKGMSKEVVDQVKVNITNLPLKALIKSTFS